MGLSMAVHAMAALILVSSASAFMPGISSLRAFSAPSLRATCRRGPSSLKMVDKDYVDSALAMMKMLQGSLNSLDDTELVRLSGVCSRVVDDITILRKKAGKGGNINAGSIKDMTPEEIEAENEAFFNDGTAAKDLVDDLPPPPKAAAKAAAKPKAAPAMTKEKLGEASIRRTAERSQVTEVGKAISKYTPDKVRGEVIKTATEEADVGEDEYLREYRKVFGVDPSTEPLIDDETPRPPPPKGQEHTDAFAEVRRVQASAKDYESSEEYYAKLNQAIANWKKERTKKGELQGTAVSDRYMDQLAIMKPFDAKNTGRKFSLDCMLVEEEGKDEDGNKRGILVMTDVDGPGALGMAGCIKGDALLEVNGTPVPNYKALREVMAKVHSSGKMEAEVLVQKKGNRNPGYPELIQVSSE